MLNQEQARVLSQYIDALDEAVLKLEEYYTSGDIKKIEKSKKLILDIQLKIQQIIGA